MDSSRRKEGDQEIWSYLHLHGLEGHTLRVLKHDGHSFIYKCPTSFHLLQRSNSTSKKQPGNQLCWSQRRTKGGTETIGSWHDNIRIVKRELWLLCLQDECTISQSFWRCLGKADPVLSKCYVCTPREEWCSARWRSSQDLPLWSRSNHQQPSINCWQSEWPWLFESTDSKPPIDYEVQGDSSSSRNVPVSTSLLQKVLEENPAFSKQVLVPLEERVSLNPLTASEMELTSTRPCHQQCHHCQGRQPAQELLAASPCFKNRCCQGWSCTYSSGCSGWSCSWCCWSQNETGQIFGAPDSEADPVAAKQFYSRVNEDQG